MRPEKPLPIADEFSSTEDYVQELLEFASNSDIFQVLCGGVHILDFFTNEPGLFYTALPLEWQDFLLRCEPMQLLDLLMRDDLGSIPPGPGRPPESLIGYIRDIRRLSLRRSFAPRRYKQQSLSHRVAMGMKVKKIHEVANFAGYVDSLADSITQANGKELTHFVDFGSGQNYLGRALASEPYNKHIVAVEGRESNIDGARRLDMISGVAEKEKVMRNKKLYMKVVESVDPARQNDMEALRKAAEALKLTPEEIAAVDLRPMNELRLTYTPEDGRGFIRYVTGRLENGDLADVVGQLRETEAGHEGRDPRLMAVSIHSCGNLSHYGIRSLIMNPSVQAVAIVGCCYNLLTERLGPPTYKQPCNRPSLQALNGRVVRESERRDPQGFPMSERLSAHGGGRGIRLNITARMMACQAPHNWTEKESDAFFTRHYYRAVLQKIFLDKGVISRVYHGEGEAAGGGARRTSDSPFDSSTNPVIIGSLRKACYGSFGAYVRGAIAKLTTNADFSRYSAVVGARMGDMTDAEMAEYEARYQPRRRELTAVWSLMAFSACVVESLIVTDRWLFLREHPDTVGDAWVEAVFDYKESPRNLVVVGVKR